jgi:hypothetical protein
MVRRVGNAGQMSAVKSICGSGPTPLTQWVSSIGSTHLVRGSETALLDHLILVLDEELDTLNGGSSSLGDGSGDTTCRGARRAAECTGDKQPVLTDAERAHATILRRSMMLQSTHP